MQEVCLNPMYKSDQFCVINYPVTALCLKREIYKFLVFCFSQERYFPRVVCIKIWDGDLYPYFTYYPLVTLNTFTFWDILFYGGEYIFLENCVSCTVCYVDLLFFWYNIEDIVRFLLERYFNPCIKYTFIFLWMVM